MTAHKHPVAPAVAAEVSPASVAAVTYGPPSTTRMDGAGGPFNDWDCKIAAALRRGDPAAAKALQEARATFNIAFEVLEPVWVPTESQLHIGMMMRVAAVDGVCTVDVPMGDDSLTYVERIAPGRIAC